MTYQHKRESTKDTRQILMENVLALKKTEYDLMKNEQEELHEEGESNIIGEEDELVDTELENYTPTQQLKFHPQETKEHIEKKKKKRNYLEYKEEV